MFNRNDFYKHIWLNNINQLLISFILYIFKVNIKIYYIVFQFYSHLTFKFVRFVFHYFNKLEKNKTLMSYFSAYFSWHNQTLESVFQFIFHYTTKHRKIIHFPGIYVTKKNYFPANKRGVDLKTLKLIERYEVIIKIKKLIICWQLYYSKINKG